MVAFQLVLACRTRDYRNPRYKSWVRTKVIAKPLLQKARLANGLAWIDSGVSSWCGLLRVRVMSKISMDRRNISDPVDSRINLHRLRSQTGEHDDDLKQSREYVDAHNEEFHQIADYWAPLWLDV